MNVSGSDPIPRLRRRIWSEHVPFAVLAETAVLRPLAERGLELVAAVFPNRTHELPRLAHACREAGVGLWVWPMLDDAEGRWASRDNARPFAAFVERLLAELDPEPGLVRGLALDLEPPIARVRATLHERGLVARVAPWLRAPSPAGDPLVAAVTPLLTTCASRGLEAFVTAIPMVLADGPRPGWQRLLGTPIDAFASVPVHVMAYSTLVQGYGPRWLRRADALALLWLCARASRARFGTRAALSLGAVGHGALGDEATYPDPAALREDVAVARAAGIEDLGLFDLGGVLARPPVEGWLDAFVDTPPGEPPPLTRRARALVLASQAIAKVSAALPDLGFD